MQGHAWEFHARGLLRDADQRSGGYGCQTREDVQGCSVVRITKRKLLTMRSEKKVNDRGAWLEATRKLISRTNPEELQEAKEAMIAAMVEEVERSLKHALPIDWSPANGIRYQLATMFSSMMVLLDLLHRQNAIFELVIFPVVYGEGYHAFSGNNMTTVAGNDEDENVEGSRLEVFVFPMLCKYSNVAGVEVSYRKMIVCIGW